MASAKMPCMWSLQRGTAAATIVALVGIVAAGCLDRNVVSNNPSVNTIVSKTITNQSIDKIDLLFVIDNSASMGDKQLYLAQAVPQLITRLVTPNCVDPTSGTIYGPSDSMGMGQCAQGVVEFPPVHDMHIGLLSTSLGTRLSDQYGSPAGSGTVCPPSATVTVNGATLTNGNDDRAELLNRSTATQVPLSDAGTSNYLNWFPSSNPKNTGKMPSAGAPAIQTPAQLTNDFTALINGIGNYGCGIESQLESWYRFLIQPDPYDSMSLDSNGHAQWVGVDTTILQQRANFLRPDSLVAIIDMTDENDSEVDVRALGGQGYAFMASNFDPPEGTSGCAENSSNSGLTDSMTCNSCDFVSSSTAASDPMCQMGNYSAGNDWGYNENLRHVHMEQKYGIWPQFPIQRYVLGLTSTTVPDRTGEYPTNAQSYQGLTNRDCVNPLFATNLPNGSSTDAATLCQLQAGPRTPDLIYYAHIGGVPFQLLQQDPTNPNSPPKETLAATDWTKILGNNPLGFDYTGIDPHMIESYQPRSGLPACPASGAAADPASGCDWVTNTGSQHVLEVDREYACIFPLTTDRDCTNTSDPSVYYACDCPSTTGLTGAQLPPLCDPTTQTTQIAAKAYPTQREMLLANLMGQQGFISSLCPIHVSPATGETQTTDPLFGYNPAVNGIVDRLKVSLTGSCSTQKLVPTPSADGGVTGEVSCLVLVILPASTTGDTCTNPGAACDPSLGLSGPSSDPNALFQQSLLNTFCMNQSQPGADPPVAANQPVCALQQVIIDPSDTKTCASNTLGTGGASLPGWCYVQGAAATALGCAEPNTIEFVTGSPPSGTVTSLQCLEEAVSVTVGDGGGD
jgi:hypothetical protein